MKVGILGGGITGLALGIFLKEKNIDFEILEKENECGGLCRSIHENGFILDYGGHVLWSGDKEILNFLLSFLQNNKVQHTRKTKIFYKGKYIKYPFENGLSELSVEERLECLTDFIKAIIKREKENLEPKNFEEWIYYTFGKAIAEKYLIPYNKKIWKFDLDKLGLDWIKIKDRLPNPNPEDIIKSALGLETEGFTSQLIFYYPQYGGFGALVNAMESKISENIIKKFEVKKVIKIKNKWIVSDGENKREYDILISTIPIMDLINSLDNVPAEVKKATENLKFNSLITVSIGLDSDVQEYHWVYIPDMDVISHKINFPSIYSSNVAPKGKSLIVADITCRFLDKFWLMSDEDLIKEVVEKLHEKKILDKNKVSFAKVVKSKYAYVINDSNYERNLNIIRKFIDNLGIKLCGRFSEFKYLNVDACVRSAKNLIESYF
ncbi:MAG: FAD-dependent oxidoreductase [Candidatus Aenigmatarchaeota archaeon]